MNLKTIGLTAACLMMAIAPLQGASAAARKSDRIMTLPLSDVIGAAQYADKVPTDIKFYFADAPVTVRQALGPVKTSRKSNNYKNHNAPESCRWAMVSALIALAEEARLQGGNAVVGIKSNFGDVESSSRDSFKCGVGGIMVGVALKGEIAVVE
jgi:hypothetical protein